MARSFKTGITTEGDVSVTGAVTASGNLRSTNSSGDEGGEIFLSNAVTNTTINGGVTIDVWQNRLRFFEQGGTARGYYIDITGGGAGVSTNLVSGGSASNSFATISTPSGTSPVADSSTDTLTFTAGTGITITGDATADSIAIATNGATANGASTLVLRDASGGFAAGAITGISFNSITGLSSTTPAAPGTAAVGTATTAARADHVHAIPTTVVATVAGTNSAELVRGNMADNDQFRILVGGTATNTGFAEIATADDGTEPIHVRQYTGVFTTLVRTATLLDASGNTSFPGTVTGTTFSGSGASLTNVPGANVTGTLTSTVLGNSAVFIGTTSVALNRTTGNLALTGISSVTLPGSTSGTVQLIPTAAAGTGTVLTLPATTGTLALTSQITTVNDATLTLAVSGVGLSGSQTFTANQSSAATFTVTSNASSANGASTLVARDASGNFTAGTITATTFSGSGASLTNVPAANVTGTLTSTVLGNSAVFIGTTSVALNRTTGNLALTGITSITGGTGTTDLDFFTANTTSANSGAIDFITGTTTTSGTTGAVIIRSGNSAAASGGVTVSTGTSTATTSGTLTLSTGNASGTGGTSGAISIATGAAGSTGNSGAITMDVGTKTTGSFGTITIGGTNASAVAIGNATNTATANLISSTSINLNSPAINSNAATLALLATPTTITMGAAVTTLTIAGTSTANATVNLATGATTGSKTVNIGTGGTSGSVAVSIGSASGSSTVTINGTITGAPTAATAATAAGNLGYVGMPQNSRSAAYGLVAGDAGKHIYYTVTGQTVTIPANSNVAFQIGTTITFITAPSVSLSIAITTDTLRLANTTTTGTRTLAANGIATAIKTTATTWIISGNGLS